jgi:hypothetical protein
MSGEKIYILIGLYATSKNIVKLGIITWPVSRLLFDERNMSINYNNANAKILEVKKDNFLYFDRLCVTWMMNNVSNAYIGTQNYYSFRKINLQVDGKKINRQTQDFILYDDTI